MEFKSGDQLFFDSNREDAMADSNYQPGCAGQHHGKLRVRVPESTGEPLHRPHGTKRGDYSQIHERKDFQETISEHLLKRVYGLLQPETGHIGLVPPP